MAAGNVTVLDRRHALVTGGGRGIGAAVADALTAQGMRVSLIGRTRETLEAAQTELGLTGGIFVADVTDEVSINDALEAFRSEHGAIEVLVNNAGAAESAPFKATSRELWDRMLAVNLTGTYTVTRAVLSDVSQARAGRIVNIASTASLKGYAYVSAYCAAKHGVLGLTRALALELAGTNATVNAVCPGFTDTDLLGDAVEKIAAVSGRSAEEARAELASSNPQGRLITPREVAVTVAWLCSDGAASVTGQAISVSGGEVM